LGKSVIGLEKNCNNITNYDRIKFKIGVGI